MSSSSSTSSSSSSSSVLKILVSAKLRQSDLGLLGGIYESKPFLETYATWGDGNHRIVSVSPPLSLGETIPESLSAPDVVTFGPFDAPTAPLNGDEAIYVKLMAQSTVAGVPLLDKRNNGNIEYTVQCGLARIPLSQALRAAVQSQPLELGIADPLLFIELCRNAALEHYKQTHPEQTTTTAHQLTRKPLRSTLKDTFSQGDAYATNSPTPEWHPDMEAIALKAYKGAVLARSHLIAGTTQEAIKLADELDYHATRPRGLNEPLVYNSPVMLEALSRTSQKLADDYAVDFIGVMNDKGEIQSPATFGVGMEKSVADLHVPYYANEFGFIPNVGMTMHTLDRRDPLNPVLGPRSAEVKHYAWTTDSARFIQAQIQSTQKRMAAGASDDFIIKANNAQKTKSHTDATINADYLLAEQIVIRAATHLANRIQYMNDIRYPNKAAAVYPVAPPPVKSTTTTTTGESLQRMMPLLKAHPLQTSTLPVALAVAKLFMPQHNVNALRNLKMLTTRKLNGGSAILRSSVVQGDEKKEGAANEEPSGPYLATECLFPVALYGMAVSDDCDGSGLTGVDFLVELPSIASKLSPEEAPILHAAKEIAARRMAFAASATVTSAFVDSDGKQMTHDAVSKMTDLPTIGDDRDLHSETGGHMPGMWLSRAHVLQSLRSGAVAIGTNVDQELPQLANVNYAAWEYRLPVLVVEGTAPTDSLVLPIGEVARALLPDASEAILMEKEAVQRKAFLKTELAKKPRLLKNVSLEMPNFYETPQPENRRYSFFYRGIAMMLSPELYAMNPRYGQLHYINPTAKTRGADLGSIQRAPLAADSATRLSCNVGMIPTYRHVTVSQWNTHFRPIMATVQNQMPVSNIYRLATPKEAELAQLRIGQPLTPGVLTAFERVDSQRPFALETAMDRHAMGLKNMQQRQKTSTLDTRAVPSAVANAVAGYGGRRRLNTICLYVNANNLAHPGMAAGMIEDLEELKAKGRIMGYETIRDRPLKNGEDILSFIITLPPVTG